MVFTSFDYLIFLPSLVLLYWATPYRRLQNLLLLLASYFFYGYVDPWFCILIGISTVVDYSCALGMEKYPKKKSAFLLLSLLTNLGLLGFFKYFNFFLENFRGVLNIFDLDCSLETLEILLPAGISFYTFQTLSYTIDVYRGKLKARHRFLDFALFVSFFPQLVAGPIERARRLLPQMEESRSFDLGLLSLALPLLLRGYMKKMVIAENVAPYVDKIFILSSPSVLLLFSGSLAFALQIYADFSAYTDIARASARLFGFELMENFYSPYLAISPSDFWRRWHVSFSSWIRDYLYIPLGGSRVESSIAFLGILLASLGLSGLWHGASWHFVAWGVFHALLVFIYHKLGMGGRWKPKSKIGIAAAWLVMSLATIFAWSIFRCPNLSWLLSSLLNFHFSKEIVITATLVTLVFLTYTIPLLLLLLIDRFCPKSFWANALLNAFLLVLIVVLGSSRPQDFIYFRF